MRTVDFYELTRAIQSRFIDSSRGVGVPTPLAFQPHRQLAPVGWGAAAGLTTLLLFWFARTGYGDLKSRLAIMPVWTLAVYFVLGAALVFCVLRTVNAWRVEHGHPYRPGLYVFPVGVIDARGVPFRVHPVSDLTRAEATTRGRVKLEFKDGVSFDFDGDNREHAESVRQTLDEAIEQLADAESNCNTRQLALLDPLKDTGFSNPFSPTAPYQRPRALRVTFAALAAVVAGTALGGGLWAVRNKLSERKLYAAAVKRNDVEGYRTFLARGGHRREVRDLLLPRAELARARSTKSVAAVEQYIKTHASSRIQSEVSAALRAALLDELGEARERGSLKSLQDFASRYGHYEVVAAEVDEAKKQVFADVLRKFKERSPDEQLELVVTRLLDYARQHGPKVEIKFVRRASDSYRVMDMVVRKSAYFRGTESIPSQYFDEQHTSAREAKAGATIAAELSSLFPSDVLDFVLVAPMNLDGDAPLPDVKVPTLYIEQRTELSGGYLSALPRAIFVGAGIIFKALLTLPADADPWTLKHAVWKTPEVALMREEGKTTADVYEEQASAGYDTFVEKLLAHFGVKTTMPP